MTSGFWGLGECGRTLRCAQITPVSHSASMIALYRIASGAIFLARICVCTQCSQQSQCKLTFTTLNDVCHSRRTLLSPGFGIITPVRPDAYRTDWRSDSHRLSVTMRKTPCVAQAHVLLSLVTLQGLDRSWVHMPNPPHANFKFRGRRGSCAYCRSPTSAPLQKMTQG